MHCTHSNCTHIHRHRANNCGSCNFVQCHQHTVFGVFLLFFRSFASLCNVLCWYMWWNIVCWPIWLNSGLCSVHRTRSHTYRHRNYFILFTKLSQFAHKHTLFVDDFMTIPHTFQVLCVCIRFSLWL